MKAVLVAVAGFFTLMLLVAATGAGTVTALLGGGATGVSCGGQITHPHAHPAGLTAEQAGNAAVILAVGQRMRVPVRGWVIAIATALQESDLRNRTTATDHDSLGLFQQRPSAGWGTPRQLTTPAYAARAFYRTLLRVPGWQRLPLTRAAQAVQHSAYPDAYAKHEHRAAAIVAAYTGGRLPACPATTSGWTRPVPGHIVSGFRTRQRPDHDGIDIAAPRATTIRAAASGLVVTVLCNVAGRTYTPTGRRLPCDRDGHPGLGGCGWYVEIRHPSHLVTRYCHMLRQPLVTTGQTVTAGQPLGLVGTSGDSSGPHLHLEIHTGYPANSNNAINPLPYLRARGVTFTAK